MESSYSSRCPAVKRLFRERCELQNPTEEYFAQPLEDNLFEWHFTVRGPPDTDYDGGVYHGRIILPSDYPMKPPNIIFLTPNGRFETHRKICLSISGHHPETWQPSWSIRTALLAIIGFMPTPGMGTIGGLDYTPSEKAKLAIKSQDFSCPECGNINKLLKDRTSSNEDIQKEAKEMMSQITVTDKKETTETDKKPEEKVSDAVHEATTEAISEVPYEAPSTTSSAPIYNTVLLSVSIFILVVLVFRRVYMTFAEEEQEL